MRDDVIDLDITDISHCKIFLLNYNEKKTFYNTLKSSRKYEYYSQVVFQMTVQETVMQEDMQGKL